MGRRLNELSTVCSIFYQVFEVLYVIIMYVFFRNYGQDETHRNEWFLVYFLERVR